MRYYLQTSEILNYIDQLCNIYFNPNGVFGRYLEKQETIKLVQGFLSGRVFR